MKTCLITSQYPPQIGGLGHSAFRVAKLLAESGIETHVLLLQKHDTALPLDECIVSTHESSVHVHRAKVFSPGTGTNNSAAEPENLTRYHREMFDVLNHLQQKHGYEVLLGFFLYPAGFIAAMVGKLHGVKVITSIRGNDVGKYAFDPLRLPFIQTALRNADAITSVATSLIDFADRTITPIAHKSSTILNGIDVLALKPKARPSIKLGGLIIGSIGLFRYKKGLVYLCKALETLAPKDAMPFTLLLIGDYFKEADRQAHEVLFEKYGLQGRTVVTGRVAHTDIADYLQLLDIAVFPSLFSEGCPLSMLEAMAMGKAIVASNSGAIPEIIQHRVHGLLVKAGSATEIAKALLELTEDAQLRTRLGRNAKAAAAKMTIERERRQWLSVYDKISTIKTHSH